MLYVDVMLRIVLQTGTWRRWRGLEGRDRPERSARE